MRTPAVFALALSVLIPSGCAPVDSADGEDTAGDAAGDSDGDNENDGDSPGTGTPGNGGGGPVSPPEEETCDEVTPIEIVPAFPPDMLLVVDKSGSMDRDLDNSNDHKWTVMRTALNDVVGRFQAGINFGLMLYPLDDDCDPGIVEVGVAPGSGGSIQSLLAANDPDGNTPTHSSLQGALAYYNSIPVNPGGRFVLLATDGQPNCTRSAEDKSVDAIAALNAAGIATFVLGFGDGVAEDTLQDMAEAGGTSAFYKANSPAELAASLDAIADELALPPCTLALTETPPDADDLAVYFDDAAIPRSPSQQDGWDYDAASNSINLFGTACETLQSGAVDNVRVDYGCGGPIVQ